MLYDPPDVPTANKSLISALVMLSLMLLEHVQSVIVYLECRFYNVKIFISYIRVILSKFVTFENLKFIGIIYF